MEVGGTKKVIYIATYSSGMFDSYNYEVFASHDKSKVAKWVKRFNSILKRLKQRNKQFEKKEFGMFCIKDEYATSHFLQWLKVRDLNNAFIQEIELR